MPLYDFRCPQCEEHFEALVAVSEVAPCPACGAEETERVYSAFAGPFLVRPRGLAARRADAKRTAREEQRQERRETRRAAQKEQS